MAYTPKLMVATQESLAKYLSVANRQQYRVQYYNSLHMSNNSHCYSGLREIYTP